MDEITRFRASSTATSSKAAGFNNSWNVPQSPFTSTTQMTTNTVEFRQRGQATTVQVDVNHADISPKSAPSPIYHQAASKTPRLISWDELPAWHQDSPYILTGYRPISNSVPISIQSLLYLHNETLNIYTHLVPSILFFSLQFLTHNYFNAHYPNSSKWDIVIFSIFFLSAAICLGMSAAYHTLMNHSRIISEAMLRMDFVGIMVLILGKFISGIYVGFFCEPVLRSVYYTMILSLGSITTMVLVNPKYQGLKYRKFRLATFISTALSAFAPLAHSIRIFGWEQNWRQSGMPFYLTEGLILVIGSVFYSMRIPECYRPGRFDIVGASHQIFHVLVVAATVVHLYGLLQTYDYAYHHRVCRLV